MNPLEHKGIPVADQLRSWSELIPDPYDTHEVDPYTRCRIILMNGIEVEANLFSHQFNRHCDIPEVRENRAASGDEYRLQTEGPHPVERLRTPELAGGAS